MRRNLSESVVVITGASSGIGRATALKFADQHATVVLTARRAEALNSVAEECRMRGARALVVPVDVTDEQQVHGLAQKAIDTYGRIDIWVHNAAVCAFGRVDEIPIEAFRRAVDVNLMGYIHGTRAALSHMRKRGKGMLIYVDSIVTSSPQPYTSAYAVTKAAVRSLSDAVRMELELEDAPDIDVCTVMPASIDTPLFQQAANYTGRAIKTLDPVYTAETVADEILGLTQRPRRAVYAGRSARLISAVHTLMPRLYERFIARHIYRNLLRDEPAQLTDGNLYHPLPQYARISGGWLDKPMPGVGKAAIAGAVLALPLAAWAWVAYSSRQGYPKPRALARPPYAMETR